jgi:hypothetical protein
MKWGSVTLTLALSLEGEGTHGCWGIPTGAGIIDRRAIHGALYVAALQAVSLLDSLFPVVRSLMKIATAIMRTVLALT